MQNGPTKKQHYVPQFYLRQWCDDKGGFYPVKIEEREPPKLLVFKQKSNPNRFCYENFFYAQHTGIEDELSQQLEKAFAEVEGDLHEAIPKIEEKIIKNEQITDEDKYHLAEFMIFLWIRGKAHREHSQKMTENLFKQINKMHMPYIDQNPKIKALMDEKGITKNEMIEFAEKGEYRVETGNAHHLALLKDMTGFCNMLAGKYWKLYLSRESKFITTDSPYLDKALSKTFWGNDFLSREQSFILSPRVVIVARFPNNFSGKKIKREDITGNIGAIQSINCHNLMQAIRFGFHKEQRLLEELQIISSYLYQYRSKEKVT